jgi:ribosomal protein L22
MTPSKPGDPSKGKPAEEEQAELEAKEAAAVEAAQEQETAEEKPKRSRSRSRSRSRKQPEPTAADETEVGKESAREAAKAASAEQPPAEAQDESAEPAPAEAQDESAEPAPAEAQDESAQPAPARARTRERPAPGERVLVRAQAKYVRTSARKARLVCDHIRGKSVQEARAILALTPRAVSRDWSKLLESAVANAENNHELLGDELRIAQVTADEGPTLKRYRPRAMGRATRIRKRTSHLTILLTPKES